MKIAIVGPDASTVSGSLLRSLNILHAIRNAKIMRSKYVSIKSVAYLPLSINSILQHNVVIISGINPWIAALICLIGRLFRKKVILDLHGCSWYEYSMTPKKNIMYATLLFSSELLACKLASHVIVASKFLAKLIRKVYRRRTDGIVENATTPVFESLAKVLTRFDKLTLRVLIERTIGIPLTNCKLLIAPLPNVFWQNLEAYKVLVSLLSKPKNLKVIVTGLKGRIVNDGLICVGYVPYTLYVALLLASDGVILPYPPNAVCGGVRNKVLEAGYCKRLIISTHAGVFHMDAKPWEDYIPLEYMWSTDDLEKIVGTSHTCVENMFKKIIERYTSNAFKSRILDAFNDFMKA
ncbi:MAG: hypothetical protein QXS32_07525 [Candidatus Nezhaarchaeales archaeon]